MTANVSVVVQNASGIAQVPKNALISDWIGHVLAHARPGDNSFFEMGVRIVDEDESRALNNRFRHVDKPTNVLAFPADDEEFAALRGDTETKSLGDLIVCGPVVLQEAAQQAKSPENHWLHLLLHGTLHLLGFDHETEQEARRMESLETHIMAARGLDDPYHDR